MEKCSLSTWVLLVRTLELDEVRANERLVERGEVEAVLRDERAPVVAAASAAARTAARAVEVRAATEREQGVVHRELLA